MLIQQKLEYCLNVQNANITLDLVNRFLVYRACGKGFVEGTL